MKNLAIGVLLSFALVVSGCSVMKRMGGEVVGSGNMKTEKREVPAFTSVATSGAFTVDVVCQKERSLSLEGDDNILPLVSTEVKGGTLYIDSQKSYSSKKPVVVRISVPDITGLTSSGAGEFTIANIKNEVLHIDISGAATVKATGETKNLTIKMSGAGSIQTSDLKATDVEVTMSGAGNADVYASNKLNADISGAGSVTYAGDPPTVNKNISGIGSIAKK
jgi:hypothetical protein